MLPAKNRLKKSGDFQKVFKQGKFFSLNGISLTVLEDNSDELIRVGFIVSKKFSNKATLRNQAKRLLREAISKNLPKIKSGCQIVLAFQSHTTPLEFNEVMEVVTTLLKKSKIIKIHSVK